MIRKVLGIIIMIAGCLLLVMLLSNGLLLPHILGPIILVVTGILLLALKRKGNRNE